MTMERWHYLLLLIPFFIISSLKLSQVELDCAATPSASACRRTAWASHKTEGPHSTTSTLESPIGYVYFSSDPTAEHPIHRLIREGQAKWQSKLDRQSTSLEEAVAEYRRRYNRAPPKGFGLWYKFARERNVQLLDEYDSIHEKILPYTSLPSAVLRRRLKLLQEHPEDWVRDRVGTVSIEGGRVSMAEDNGRLRQISELMHDFAMHLPDMQIVSTAKDEPAILVPGAVMDRHLAAARRGEYIDEKYYEDMGDELAADGLVLACPPNSSMRTAPSVKKIEDITRHGTVRFVETPALASDMCRHALQRLQHGITSTAMPQPTILFPHFALSLSSPYADLPLPPCDAFRRDPEQDSPWKSKRFDKLIWRGRGTGAHYDLNTVAAKLSHRLRLSKVPERKGNITLNLSLSDKGNSTGPLTQVTFDAQDLARQLFDIHLVDGPLQCGSYCHKLEEEFNWRAPPMSQEEQSQYKYIIDVDGNGWSGRYQRLLGTNAVVLKSTVFTEWYAERPQPWVHYVPISLDYADLWEVMTFFRGDVEGRGAHDALAERIGRQGKEWRAEFWRWEDMQAYLFRTLLEYARVMNVDPEDPSKMDYRAT